MFRSSIIIILFLFSNIVNSANFTAIERIQHDSKSHKPTHIIMNGTIERGDFKKLLKLLIEDKAFLNDFPRFVIIGPSEGGDLMEAMKIGEFIKMLNLKVLVNKKCYSACTFIVLSSKYRRYFGDMGFHRPYFGREYYAGLSHSDADKKYKKLYEIAKNFLRNNYVSQSVIDKMFAHSSNEMWVIDQHDSRIKLGQFQPPFQEWLYSKCPNSSFESVSDDLCIIRNVSDAQDIEFTKFYKEILTR